MVSILGLCNVSVLLFRNACPRSLVGRLYVATDQLGDPYHYPPHTPTHILVLVLDDIFTDSTLPFFSRSSSANEYLG
jgi:hypothetical protein